MVGPDDIIGAASEVVSEIVSDAANSVVDSVPEGTSSAVIESDTEVPDVKGELLRDALGWAKTIVFAIVFALVINNWVIVNASVPTASMEGTIRVNDRIVAFRLSYIFSEPSAYDIIVFEGPDDDSILYVKRIVGLPGEEIMIRDGRVFINGAEEPQRYDFVQGHLIGNHGPYLIPEGHFFVMGDNRTNSVDSRHWASTFVPREKILGRVVFRYFPGFRNLANT